MKDHSINVEDLKNKYHEISRRCKETGSPIIVNVLPM